MTRYAKSHTQITIIIDTSEQGTMRPYLHEKLCKITHTHTSILLAGRRSCSQVVDLAARGH
jgi:hypothetical protein